jgi:glycosyltransferase involved in cell wall biosynthesis
MRIVFVVNSPTWGGLERYTVDIASGLAARGHDVHAVVTPGGPVAQRLASSDVRTHPVGLGIVAGWHASIGQLSEPLFAADLYANPWRRLLHTVLDRISADGRIDLLHAQHLKEKLWVTSAGEALGIPVAWTVHAPLEPWMVRGVPGRVHRWAVSRVAGIVAVNDAARLSYERFGYPRDRLITVHNGIPLDAYTGGDGARVRAELRIRPDETVLLMPARPYVGKGVAVLLEALAGLRADSWARTEGRPVRTLVVGDSRHVEHFRESAAALGLAESVHFLGHRDDMRDLYATADIVTLPSLYEGLPYVIMEAMAASRAVVASDVGGIPEMIDDEVGGLLVPAEDADALADALRRLILDADLRSALADAGRRAAEERFTYERMVETTEAEFARIAGRGTH